MEAEALGDGDGLIFLGTQDVLVRPALVVGVGGSILRDLYHEEESCQYGKTVPKGVVFDLEKIHGPWSKLK